LAEWVVARAGILTTALVAVEAAESRVAALPQISMVLEELSRVLASPEAVTS